MLRVYADQHIALGEMIQDTRVSYYFHASEKENNPRVQLTAEEKNKITQGLNKILRLCNELELPVSFDLIKSRIGNIPETEREYDLLTAAVYSELKNKLFLFVRPHLSKYYNDTEIVAPETRAAFPSAFRELYDAGNAAVSALWTASVFHSMRAAEIGVRVLGKELGVTFPNKPIDFAEWQQVLDQADAKIKAISQSPRSTERDSQLHFFSTAAAEFRYFKDGWRVRVAHARADYGEAEAIKILDHTRDFFDHLSGRLSE